MGQGAVKVCDEGIDVLGVFRLGFHAEIPVFHGLGHFTLAHVFPDDLIAAIQGTPDGTQHLFKIGGAFSKARGAEEKDFFVPQLPQQGQGILVGVPFVGPEAYIDRGRGGDFPVPGSKIGAVLPGQGIVNGFGQELCIAGGTGKDNGLGFLFHGIISLII